MDGTSDTKPRYSATGAEGDPFSGLVTNNSHMQQIVESARHVAPTPYSVLLEGETGTGKEVFARAIHVASGRSGEFVPLNCSAVPEHMFEAEFFGARRGAYTGLDVDRSGLFKASDGGTLFLDEVGDLPAATQAKLLRVLDDRVVRPLGGTESYMVDVRIIAASHRSLASLVEEGMFREDLFFRLSATHLKLLPIRERPEDLPAFMEQALRKACAMQGIEPRVPDYAASGVLLNYGWPGNVRELNNVIAMAVLNAASATIKVNDLPMRCRERRRVATERAVIRFDLPFFDALAEFERAYISDVLRRTGGNITEAARISALSRGTVRNKARSHGLMNGAPRSSAPRSRVRRPTDSGGTEGSDGT